MDTMDEAAESVAVAVLRALDTSGVFDSEDGAVFRLVAEQLEVPR